MVKKNSRILVGMLCLGLVAPLIITGCGDKKAMNSTETIPVTEETTLSVKDSRNAISDDLPERDYNGYNFRIAARDRDDFVQEVGSDLEETGDVIDDAIYHRNQTVEDRFNIKISSVHDQSPQKMVRSSVLAGDDAFDLVLGQVIEMGSTVIEGNYLNWDDLPYVNLEKPWYINNAAETISMKDKSYMMSGEYCFSILQFTYCMFFNKELCTRYNVPNPYQTVKDGKWTIDYVNRIVKDVYDDMNGDGKQDDGDLYGFTSDYYSAAITYQYAFDNPVMTKNMDGIPELTYNSPKMVQIVEKVYDFFYNNVGSMVGTWGVSGPIWESGRAMLLNGLFSSAIEYRDSEIDFGILPYPKFDEAQERYLTMSDGAHSIMAVPITVTDFERTGIIIEALNAESYKQVIPAYYEIALKVKYSRDEESVEVLDMILEGRYFDFGYLYDGWKGVAFLLQDLMSTKSTNYTSAYEKKEKSAKKHYQSIIDAYLQVGE